MNKLPTNPASPSALPLVVQLSFAGSRFLFDAEAYPNINADEFHAAVRQHLTESLNQLPQALGLSGRHFCCGLSQLAIGADMLFTQACQDLAWPQRVLLPQQREDFLNAKSAGGKPDFDETERQQALALFNSPHVIQEQVASVAPDRHTRFHDINLELVRLSDVVVCLVNAATDTGKPGGTHELVKDAHDRKRPMLVIRVGVTAEGKPEFNEEWHHLDNFTPPGLPHELADCQPKLSGIPNAMDFCVAVKNYASDKAKQHQALFKYAALIIIGTHAAATVLAVAGLKAGFLPWLLASECLLLLAGFVTHQYLHRAHATQVWAMARLVAELVRSVAALKGMSGHLAYLFYLPLPSSLRPLLRTLNVLHLRDARALTAVSWRQRLDEYIGYRFENQHSGQIPYYKARLEHAKFWHTLASATFVVGSGLAIVATLGELLETFHIVPIPTSGWERC